MYKRQRIIGGLVAGLVAVAGLALPKQAQAYDGDYCREYTRTVMIGNRHEEAYGTACLRGNGDWEIVSESQRRPVSYERLPGASGTVFVRQPSQVVYYNHRPTTVRFYGTSYRRPYHGRYVHYDSHRHHHGKGHYKHRGHGHNHDRDRGHDHDRHR